MKRLRSGIQVWPRRQLNLGLQIVPWEGARGGLRQNRYRKAGDYGAG